MDIEVERLTNHYLTKKQELESYINQHSGIMMEIQPKVIRGAVATFKKKMVRINNTLCSLGFMLCDYLTDEIKAKLPTSKVEAEHASSQLDTFAFDSFEIMPDNESSSSDGESDDESLLEFSDEDSDVAE